MQENSERIIHSDSSTPYRRVLSASTLCHDSVRNRMNDEVGSIKELMIDIPTGRIAYAVMSVGGFLGMGDKLFAIPWQALTLDEDRKCFVMDVDRNRFEEAPGFDKEHWPDMADSAWSQGVRGYWEDAGTMTTGTATRDDLGINAGRNYDQETAGFSDREVSAKAQEARRAVDSPEGASLREAEAIGKSRSKADRC